MRTLLFVGLAACGEPAALEAVVSARAAPVPVMLGPIRCVGKCRPEPTLKTSVYTAYSRLADEQQTVVENRWEKTYTSTTVTASPLVYSYALVDEMLKKVPFNRNWCVQLDHLTITWGYRRPNAAIADDRTSLYGLGDGYFYDGAQ